MRIVLDLQACQATNRERGIGRYSISLAQAIARHIGNHDLRIVLNSQFVDTIKPIQNAFDGLLSKQHITVFDTPKAVSANDSANGWRYRAAEKVREDYLASLQPDIVHLSSLFEGWGDDAVTSAGFGTAVTLYDLIPLQRKETYLTNPQMRDWYYRKVQALKNAQLLLAISEYSRTEAIATLQLPPQRVVNISAAIDDIFRPQILSFEQTTKHKAKFGLHKSFLMYTGGIDSRKNIEGLIEAYAMLPDAVRTNYQLAIICKINPDERHRLEVLASRFGLEKDALILTGYVTDQELIALYNTASLFVFPSLSEGFGLPVLEAMSCGLPVIGSNNSSIPEVIGRQDALFDPTNLTELTAKIHQVLEDEAFRITLREHGLKQAQKFTWDNSAKLAIAAFEQSYETQQQERKTNQAIKSKRPRLAYVSPLPPEKTGIADYSAELIPELARYYDIELITDQAKVEDNWLTANFPVRSVAWYQVHAKNYDRIMYQFGNSAFHQHMFALLAEHPGIVVLHDFFLSGVLNYLDYTGYLPGALSAAQYESHGYPALIDQKTNRDASIWKYPCNKVVLDQATGIIVHSRFSISLAEAWYGVGSATEWRHIPHLRAMPEATDRQATRAAIGIAETDFVVCAFGLLGITKLNDRLLKAWLNSPLATDSRCHLVFVGQNDDGSYGADLSTVIAESPQQNRIKITGFASQALYRQYLASADVAVQLRTRSRGETSGTVLDCMAYGIPTIVNAHGSSADLPNENLLKLNNEFTQAELVDALTRLWSEAALRQKLSSASVDYIKHQHHPAQIGQMYRDAIEHFAYNSSAAQYQKLISAIASINTESPDLARDTSELAKSIAVNRPSKSTKQLFVDISELVQRDPKSGIQRVVRNILEQFLKIPPQDYRIEPVYQADGQYHYARQFTTQILGLDQLDDAPIEFAAGDIFLGLDLAPQTVIESQSQYKNFSNHGVGIYFVVYDLLPILRPDVFVEGAKLNHQNWLETVVRVSDGIICISRAVAEELQQWFEAQQLNIESLKIRHFHLGADIVTNQVNTAPTSPEINAILSQISKHPTMLMVGTLEPRKGHDQALSAFEKLWAQGQQINLVIVGKQGWLVDSLVQRLQKHPENNQRLFWFESADDSLLIKLYQTATALLAASQAEGFGLPLIEAAQYKLPIIARDLPVFREVAGEHAFYFSGQTDEALASALLEWIKLSSTAKAPLSEGLPWLTWSESAQQLLKAIIDK